MPARPFGEPQAFAGSVNRHPLRCARQPVEQVVADKRGPRHLARPAGLHVNGVEESRACGYTQNIGREGTFCETCTLTELKEKKLDMFTTVFIGNSESEIVQGRLITKRGYSI